MANITINDINPGDTGLPARLAGLWNAAMGAEWAVTPRALRYNLRPSAGVLRAGQLAEVDGLPIGFALVERGEGGAEGSLVALAVDPRYQGRGAGSALLAWALDWLADRGVREVYLGGGARPWIPGLPEDAEQAQEFFLRRGFAFEEKTWDMACGLQDYDRPALSQWPQAEIHPATEADLPALFDLLARDFDYWLSDYAQFIDDGGRPSDIIVLYAGGALRAFCWTTLEDSARPLERFFPNRLGRPWAQLGSIGTAAADRGLGYAGVMIDYALRRLRDLGVDGCVIDWTVYLDFYAKFGFAPYHAYRMMQKTL